MTAASLTARANEGDGTDQLAGFTTATGFAGAMVPVTEAGAPYDAGNPFPVALMSSAGSVAITAAALPLPTGAATTAGQAAILAALGTPLQEGGTVAVSNLPATQAISAAALPLPAGAATAAAQASILAALGAPLQAGGAVSVSNLPATQAISAVALPLPTGAATLAKQDAIIAALGTPLQAGGAVSVSNFPATQPVSLASVPLPTGAATEGTLAALAGAVKAEDSAHVSGDPGIPMLGIRSSSDAPTTNNDGDYTNLKLDEEGRLKVSSKPASYADITGDITAIQATIGTPVAGGTVEGDVSRASNVMMSCSGTFSAINCAFEGSLEAAGATNWFSLQAVRSNANVIETATGNLSAQPIYAWELSVNALKRVRVRATARASGTQSWRIVQGTYATEPIPAAQASGTQPVSGTVTATVGTSITGGTISPLTVAGVAAEAASAKTASGNSAAAITNASGSGVMLFLMCTAVAGASPTLAVRVQVWDPFSGVYVDLPGAVFPTITGTTAAPLLLTICPGIVAVANAAVNMPMPRTYRLAWTITGTTPSFTFSVGAQYII